MVGMDYMGDSGGGGFSSNGSNGGGTSSRSSQSPRTRRAYDEQTLLPLTVRMVLKSTSPSAEENGNQIPDGRKASTVVLVGAVRNVNDLSTNVVYELEDGTGLVRGNGL